MPLEPVPDRGAIRFQTHRDAGGVLNATFALLRRNARELFIGFLAIVGPIYIASSIVQALYLARLQQLAASPEAMFDVGGLVTSVLPSAFGIIVLGFLAGVIAQAAAGTYVRLYRDGLAGEVTVGTLWEETKDLILPLAGLNLVVGLAAVFSGLLNILPCLGTIIWFGLLVWASPIVAVTMAARVVESPSLGAAWERARVLVKGSWGFAFGSLLIAIIVFLVISFALAIPAQIAAMAVGVNTLEDGSAEALPLIQILFSPIQLLTALAYLIPLLTAYFVHGRLVEELEGTSLVEDLDDLAAPAAHSSWADERSTPPSTPPPPASGPEGEEDEAPPPSGFRGGGFRGGA